MAAVVREETGAALAAGGLVEVEADQTCAAGPSAEVLVGTVLWLVEGTGAGAHRTMWLSEARKSYCPTFKVDTIQGNVKIVSGVVSELLIIRQPG